MKGYIECKDSGVEWIGKIPSHWNRKQLKFSCNIQGRVGYKGYTVSDLVSEGEGPYTLGAKHISKDNKLDLSQPEFISWEKYYESPEIMVQTGDLLLTQRGTLGKVVMIERAIGEATINPSMVLLNKLQCVTKYLYYFFNSDYFAKWIDFTNTATAVPMISQEQLGNFSILLPTQAEQTQIAQYLDHKTSEIDKLITDKEKLIELLNEERTATINQAVSKGLNLDVPMKDSGIEWLGEVPEHWGVFRLRYLAKEVKTGTTPPSDNPEYFDPGDIEWFTPGDFKNIHLESSNRKVSIKAVKDAKCKIFPANSVFIIGIGATLGKIGLISVPASCNQQINAIIFDESRVEPRYGAQFLDSYSQISVSMASSATLAILNQSQTKNLFITVPPLLEQSEILGVINSYESNFNALSLKIQQEIQLLKEYKTALISEVVTGKVDVRGEVIAQSTELVP
jgi:type I restriction enzyme S subunit